jgi:hypothetical protein
MFDKQKLKSVNMNGSRLSTLEETWEYSPRSKGDIPTKGLKT